MALFTNEDEKILIIQPLSEKGGRTKIKRLKTFKNLKSLERALRGKGWTKMVEKLGEKHSDLIVDWEELREHAEVLVGGPLAEKTETDQLALEFRGKLAEARSLLNQEPQGLDWEILRRSGTELRYLLKKVALLLECHRHPEVERFGLWEHTQKWDELTGATEEAFEMVEQARHLFRHGRRKQARKLLGEARRLDPFDPDNENSEGVLLEEIGEFEEAEKYYLKAEALARHELDLDDEPPWAWGMTEIRPLIRALSNRANICFKTGRIDEAIALWTQCQLFCPDNPLFCSLALGNCYLHQDKPKQALEHYELEKFQMIPVPDPHFQASLAHFHLDELEKAVDEMIIGMLTNVYIAPQLLREKVEPRRRHWTNTVDPEWANDYLETNRALWKKGPLRLLRLVYEDKEVAQERTDYLKETRDERDRSLLKGELKRIKARVLSKLGH